MFCQKVIVQNKRWKEKMVEYYGFYNQYVQKKCLLWNDQILRLTSY